MKYTSLLILLLMTQTLFGQVYDAKADPFEQVKEASIKAKKENKHIFVMIGGDWCIWCKSFDQLMNTDSLIQNAIQQNFEVIHVNYSKDNKNTGFLKKYQNPTRFGFPVFLILDADGQLLHTQNSEFLEEPNPSTKGHSSKKVLAFLNAWQPEALMYHDK